MYVCVRSRARRKKERKKERKKLIGAQIVKDFSPAYGIPSFITAFMRVRH